MRIVRTGAVIIVAMAAAVALGNAKIQIGFTKLVKPAEGSALAKAGCVVCHAKMGKADLNPFGKDMADAMKALKTKELTKPVLDKIAKLDSDKDKATNEQELKAGTLPGHPKSKPAPESAPAK